MASHKNTEKAGQGLLPQTIEHFYSKIGLSVKQLLQIDICLLRNTLIS